MIRVLGVDPGSAATGWALVVGTGNRYRLEAHGVLRPRGDDRSSRLAALDEGLCGVIASARPGLAAVESPFSGRNPRSGLVLAEARGVILAVLGRRGVPVASYSPAQVKSTVVGLGRAEKRQVAYMVVRLLGLSHAPPEDAADAMAVAITHLHLAGRPGAVLDPRKSPC